jgi:hypothetical protein
MGLVKLEEAKRFAMIDHARQDDVLPYILDGIEEWIQKFTGALFQTSYSTLRDYADGGRPSLRLPHMPIVTVEGVYDRESSFTEYDSSLYYFNKNGIWLQGDGAWAAGRERWRVHYTAGYTPDNLPVGLRMLILQLFKRAYDSAGGKDSESVAGYSEKWQELLTSDEIKQLRGFSFQAGAFF